MGISILEESIRNSPSSRRDFLRTMGKTAVGAAFLSSFLKTLEARGQLASIIAIGTDWSFDEIAAVLIGEPAHGSPGAQSGDTALFSPGDFGIPMRIPRVHYKIEVPNLIARGTTYDSTRFIGASPLSGLIFETRRDTITLSDFRTENSWGGTKIGGNNFDNISLLRIKSFGHEVHYMWDEQNAPQPLGRPSIVMDSCLIEGGSTGMHFSERNGATMRTKYLGGLNCTARNLTGIVVDDPVTQDENGNYIFLGNDDFRDWIIEGGTSFREDLYRGMRSPEGFVEWAIDAQSLEERGIGRYNIHANPLLDENAMPQRGSPAVNCDMHERCYAGYIRPSWLPEAQERREILTPKKIFRISP